MIDLKIVASLEANLIAKLTDKLKMEAIPFVVQKFAQEGGLDYSNIMVESFYYDRACDIAEKWDADQLEEAEKNSNRHCPTCGSTHLEYSSESFGRSIWKCKNCENVFSK